MPDEIKDGIVREVMMCMNCGRIEEGLLQSERCLYCYDIWMGDFLPSKEYIHLKTKTRVILSDQETRVLVREMKYKSTFAEVAQLEEHWSPTPEVEGSIPSFRAFISCAFLH